MRGYFLGQGLQQDENATEKAGDFAANHQAACNADRDKARLPSQERHSTKPEGYEIPSNRGRVVAEIAWRQYEDGSIEFVRFGNLTVWNHALDMYPEAEKNDPAG